MIRTWFCAIQEPPPHSLLQLIVGNTELSFEQAKAQMSIWAIWSAPLIMSNDLRTILPEYRNILLNPLVIAVDQDPLGIMGRMVFQVVASNMGIKGNLVIFPLGDSILRVREGDDTRKSFAQHFLLCRCRAQLRLLADCSCQTIAKSGTLSNLGIRNGLEVDWPHKPGRLFPSLPVDRESAWPFHAQ